MTSPLDDPRIARGMQAQLDKRRALIAAGDRPLGWKVGLGTPAAMQKLGIGAPLIGFLMQSGRLDSGATAPLAGWAKPVAEPEIAVHFGSDLPAGADETTIRAAIAGLGAAIELADLDPPPDDVETILAGDIYQRHAILGAPVAARAGGSVAGLVSHVRRNGEETAVMAEVETNTGRILTIVRHVADVLAGCGVGLKAGEVLICGSITPPIFLTAEDRELVHEVDGLGAVSVQFTHA